jgi:transposase
MKTITTIGLDMAKSVFQVDGVDAAGQSVIRRQLKRRSVLAFFQKLPSFLVGIEACDSAAAILSTEVKPALAQQAAPGARRGWNS